MADDTVLQLRIRNAVGEFRRVENTYAQDHLPSPFFVQDQQGRVAFSMLGEGHGDGDAVIRRAGPVYRILGTEAGHNGGCGESAVI